MKNADYWISKLSLIKHQEGGFYRRTYSSDELLEQNALPNRFTSPRLISTAIYYLLKWDQVSLLHRLKSDELWHFYTGNPLTIHVINQQKQFDKIILGPGIENRQVFQATIKAGCWFGATVNNSDGYSLVGCTVAPGFDFRDFEIGNREELVSQYPEHRSIIERLTAQTRRIE